MHMRIRAHPRRQQTEAQRCADRARGRQEQEASPTPWPRRRRQRSERQALGEPASRGPRRLSRCPACHAALLSLPHAPAVALTLNRASRVPWYAHSLCTTSAAGQVAGTEAATTAARGGPSTLVSHQRRGVAQARPRPPSRPQNEGKRRSSVRVLVTQKPNRRNTILCSVGPYFSAYTRAGHVHSQIRILIFPYFCVRVRLPFLDPAGRILICSSSRFLVYSCYCARARPAPPTSQNEEKRRSSVVC